MTTNGRNARQASSIAQALHEFARQAESGRQGCSCRASRDAIEFCDALARSLFARGPLIPGGAGAGAVLALVGEALDRAEQVREEREQRLSGHGPGQPCL